MNNGRGYWSGRKCIIDFEWAMSTHVHSCTDAMQLALKKTNG